MARINIDDKLHAEIEFKRLVRLVEDEDVAIGLLYRFWRQAQDLWGNECSLMSKDDFEADGFTPILKAGLAEERGSGIYAKGSEKLFAWYLQRCRAGKARAEAKRDDGGRFTSGTVVSTDRNITTAGKTSSGTSIPDQPLTLTPSLTLTKNKEEEIPTFEIGKEAVKSCAKTWLDTLQHFQIRRPLNPTEELAIARAIQRFGAEYVDLALYGARYEPRSESFDPKLYVSLARIFEKDKTGKYRIEQYVNWGARKKTAAEVPTREIKEDPHDEPAPDPERVREIMAAAGFGRRGADAR